jgi:hypothetical protein
MSEAIGSGTSEGTTRIPTVSHPDVEDMVARLSAALRVRVDAERRAQDRLASFAFSEQAPTRQPGLDEPGAADIDWQYFVARTLRIVGEPKTLAVLDALRGDALPLDELAGLLEPGTRDRLAFSDWIGGLASAGLVTRELESNRVSIAPLGEALADLVAEVGRRARAESR